VSAPAKIRTTSTATPTKAPAESTMPEPFRRPRHDEGVVVFVVDVGKPRMW
jgi:hypothetical protein